MTITTHQPSTKLGDALGTGMKKAAAFFDRDLPIALIEFYQLIPARHRGRLFGGPSASQAAKAEIRQLDGYGWSIIKSIAVSNHPERPPLP